MDKNREEVTEIVLRSLSDAFEDLNVTIDRSTDLKSLAADSIMIVLAASLIEERLEIELDPSIVYSAESIDGLVTEIMSHPN